MSAKPQKGPRKTEEEWTFEVPEDEATSTGQTSTIAKRRKVTQKKRSENLKLEQNPRGNSRRGKNNRTVTGFAVPDALLRELKGIAVERDDEPVRKRRVSTWDLHDDLFQPVNLFKRFLAWVVDMTMVVLLFLALEFASPLLIDLFIQIAGNVTLPDQTILKYYFAGAIVFFYLIFPTISKGQTFGKKLFAYYVVDMNRADNPGLIRTLIREVTKPVSLCLCFFMLFSKKRRGLHDVLSNTMVTRID